MPSPSYVCAIMRCAMQTPISWRGVSERVRGFPHKKQTKVIHNFDASEVMADLYQMQVCVAVCCSVLQCASQVIQCASEVMADLYQMQVAPVSPVLPCVATVCLQCVAVCCSLLQCVAVCCSVMRVLQCIAACCMPLDAAPLSLHLLPPPSLQTDTPHLPPFVPCPPPHILLHLFVCTHMYCACSCVWACVYAYVLIWVCIYMYWFVCLHMC